MSLDNKLFWLDAGGCHWCGRNTESIKDGHDGMCPVPLLAIYDEQVAQLKAKNERLRDAIESALESRGPGWADILRYALRGE